METKTKKTTMIGAALAVAIIALAGVGYAAVTHYTATTTNTNNYMDATYMTVTQDGTGMYSTETFLTHLYFDSVTDYVQDSTTQAWDDVTTYTPVCTYYSDFTTTAPTEGVTPIYALISEELTLTVAQTGTAVSAVDIAVTASGICNFNPKLVYTLYIESKASNQFYTATDVSAASGNNAADPTWTFTGVALNDDADTDLTVMLFVSLATGTTSLTAQEATTGFGDGSVSEGVKSTTSFEFKLTATPESA